MKYDYRIHDMFVSLFFFSFLVYFIFGEGGSYIKKLALPPSGRLPILSPPLTGHLLKLVSRLFGRLPILHPPLAGHVLKLISRLFGPLHKLASLHFQVHPLRLPPPLSGPPLRLCMLSCSKT